MAVRPSPVRLAAAATRRAATRALPLVVALAGGAGPAVAADLATAPVRHDLRAVLEPETHRIAVVDTVRLEAAPDEGQPWRFLLHAGLAVSSARLAGDPPSAGVALAVDAEDGWNPRHFWSRPPYAELAGWTVAREIAVGPPVGGWGDGPPRLVLEYAGVVADSLHAPERSYERSFETTTGRIVREGAFLSGATFWVPWAGDAPVPFGLVTDTPAAWRSVSQGALALDRVDGERRTMRWDCPHPMEEIYLIAGPYELRQVDHRGVAVQAFVYADTGPEVVDPYLEATGPILDGYDALFGPYPFAKFALVENYWQTGYGMPSFTFLGDRVIRLPFIVYTSYPHEILHNWWGNGVFVAYERGNWCEGLTTYCADYRAKEAEDPAAARDYRRNQLVGYRDFADAGGRDFALTAFRGRDSAATQAVGYGKTMMVWHMLRRRLGDDTFFAALRRFYADNRFRRADWDDVRAAFETETGEDLGPWFDQWIRRPGAVRLTLEGVGAGPDGGERGGWRVHGTLVQQAPAYEVRVPVVVTGADGERVDTEIALAVERADFTVPTPFVPRTVAADPGFDLFRVLHAGEVAPTLSGILGAERARILIGADETGERRAALLALANEWADDSTLVVVEEPATEPAPAFDGGTWFFGRGPAAAAQRGRLVEGADTRAAPDDGRSLVAAGRLDGRLDRPLGWLLPADAAAVEPLGRKIPHYSKYSWLVFEGDRNVGKGQWDAGASPLTVRLSGTGAAPPAPAEEERS